MSWVALILASAVLLAVYDLLKKASVRDNAVLPVLLIAAASGAVACIGALGAAGRLAAAAVFEPRVFALVAVKSLIVAGSWVLTYCALRTLPVTIATPIRASAPALVFAAAFFLYGERPGLGQGAGMALVFAGYWFFSRAGKREGIDFRHSRAVWLALGGMVLSAASGLWDKFILQRCSIAVETVQFWFQLDLVAVYALLLGAQRLAGLDRTRFSWRWTVPLVGVTLAAADWLYFTALAQDGVMVSAASLMRRFSVVITFAAGAVLFRERNLLRKTWALALILAGIALIAACGR